MTSLPSTKSVRAEKCQLHEIISKACVNFTYVSMDVKYATFKFM